MKLRKRLENELCSPTLQLCSFSNPSRHFTYVTAHSPTLPLLHLRHSSFSNPSVALLTSRLILQPFRCFTYVTAHSPTLLSLLLRYRLFTYITWRAAHVLNTHSPTFSVTSPTSQSILQPFHRFTYVTAHSPTLLSLFLRHRLFTYVIWRAIHDSKLIFSLYITQIPGMSINLRVTYCMSLMSVGICRKLGSLSVSATASNISK